MQMPLDLLNCHTCKCVNVLLTSIYLTLSVLTEGHIFWWQYTHMIYNYEMMLRLFHLNQNNERN